LARSTRVKHGGMYVNGPKSSENGLKTLKKLSAHGPGRRFGRLLKIEIFV